MLLKGQVMRLEGRGDSPYRRCSFGNGKLEKKYRRGSSPTENVLVFKGG